MGPEYKATLSLACHYSVVTAADVHAECNDSASVVHHYMYVPSIYGKTTNSMLHAYVCRYIYYVYACACMAYTLNNAHLLDIFCTAAFSFSKVQISLCIQ